MLRDKLSRFSQHLVKPAEIDISENEYDRSKIAAKTLNGEIVQRPEGSFIKILSDFGPEYIHGDTPLEALNKGADFRLINFHNFGDDLPLDRERLLFIDTETTGLGGSGTVAFLIGCGSIIGDSFQVRQYFLPDYPDEAAMLEAVREEITPETVMVSYNGRAFDMPIIQDRMILHRVERNLEYAEHIDLLHSARRLYKRRLQSCRLSNIERNVLSFIRYDDIPGEMVPPIYFDWLNTMNTANLAGVIEHNLHDIVSLYFLMHRVNCSMDNPEEVIYDPDDVYSVARIYENRKEHERVYGILESFGGMISTNGRYDLAYMQALSYKRSGLIEKAVPLWKEIASSGTPETYDAMIELAKYYEHRIRDFAGALEIAERAAENCPSTKSAREDIRKRVKRLRLKLG